MIERYDTFDTKECPDELTFSDFNDYTIPSDYYNLLNDDDDDGNNTAVTPIDYSLLGNKGMEDAVVPNNEEINNEIKIDDDDSLAYAIDPIQNETTEIEGMDNEHEGREIEGLDAENEGVDS